MGVANERDQTQMIISKTDETKTAIFIRAFAVILAPIIGYFLWRRMRQALNRVVSLEARCSDQGVLDLCEEALAFGIDLTYHVWFLLACAIVWLWAAFKTVRLLWRWRTGKRSHEERYAAPTA